MLSDPIQVAEAIKNLQFHAGDAVILAAGPHKYVRGAFVKLKDDVEWAAIQESDGVIRSHPVEWVRNYSG